MDQLKIIGIIILVRMNFVIVNLCTKFHFTNYYFSDILPTLMALTVMYSFLLLAIIICTVELKSRQLLHSTYKLYVLSVLLQFIGILLEAMTYLKYAVNGIGLPKLKTAGK